MVTVAAALGSIGEAVVTADREAGEARRRAGINNEMAGESIIVVVVAGVLQREGLVAVEVVAGVVERGTELAPKRRC